jgi:hypothetical protein
VGDPVVEEGRRWRELWIPYQAEELRVHHRATIAPDEARAVVTALLASGRVPPQQPPLLGIQLPGARPLLERFWGTVRQHEARVYLILFINDRCLVLALSG